tara:strand:+ start:92 stop:274 length:183 start_codon:yes stop_codon:yes gene_type:complete
VQVAVKVVAPTNRLARMVDVVEEQEVVMHLFPVELDQEHQVIRAELINIRHQLVGVMMVD